MTDGRNTPHGFTENIYIPERFFLLSKKMYATSQTTLEFMVKENKDTSAQIFLTISDDRAKVFDLGRSYVVTFTRKDE